MRKAYILHSAVGFERNSASTEEMEAPAERSFYSIQARVARTQHNRYIEQFTNWNFYDGIETEPLDSTLPDEKIAFNIPTPAGIKRQST